MLDALAIACVRAKTKGKLKAVNDICAEQKAEFTTADVVPDYQPKRWQEKY